jgi:hypothetical protein
MEGFANNPGDNIKIQLATNKYDFSGGSGSEQMNWLDCSAVCEP